MTRNHWCHLDLHVPQVIRSKEGHGNRRGQGRLPGGGEGLVLNSDIISRIGVSEAGGTTKFYFNEEEMKTIEKEEIAISILSPFPQPQSIARPP